MIELERVTARQVQELHELGFPAKEISISGLEKVPCTYIAPPKGYMGAWNNNTGMINPTLDEVAKWFRDEKNIQIFPKWRGSNWWCVLMSGTKLLYASDCYDTYEEAMSCGIDYAIIKLKETSTQSELRKKLHAKSYERTELLKKLEELETEIDDIEGQIVDNQDEK